MFVFSSDCDKSLSEADESLIIIEAIQEASLSKFLPEDAPPFEKIMEDTFPGVTVSKVRHLALEVTQLWQALPGPSQVDVALNTVAPSEILSLLMSRTSQDWGKALADMFLTRGGEGTLNTR